MLMQLNTSHFILIGSTFSLCDRLAPNLISWRVKKFSFPKDAPSRTVGGCFLFFYFSEGIEEGISPNTIISTIEVYENILNFAMS